jgi:hypothetical protein
VFIANVNNSVDNKFIGGNNDNGVKQLQEYQLVCTSKWTFSKKNNYVSVSGNASQKNFKKHPDSKLFSFIAGVIDPGDQPLLTNISAKIAYKFKNSLNSKLEAENLVSDSL